ncbi:acyltransferase [Streptomyces sp. CB02959]|uniref:acyltransferase family protein n=1 Tax=Streptomyces sp. CB02959 TaxID=2020330 RepID=UPI000C27D1F8|nr:acyltransferase [Streptomyces sp. CB02959]PJN30534.1 acyltransferase [Streptomyces sp. CB02959]
MTPPAHTSRLPSLTGMRFLAAAMVFAVHGAAAGAFRDIGAAADYFRFFGNAGALGVSFFFVLSGFVLTWSARPTDTTTGFWRRRLVKIFPNHLVTFVIALALLALTGTAVATHQTTITLFLLQSWIPDSSYVEAANNVSWSLSVELLFYLSFPLLIKAINKIRPNRLWYAAATTAALVIAVPAIAQHLLPGTPHYSFLPVSWTQIWFVYVFPAVRLLEFLLGMIMARILLTGRWINLPITPAAALTAVAYLVPIYLDHNPLFNYAAFTIIPLALLIPAAAAADVQGRRTLVNTRPMVWLGEISFAFYLVHYLILKFGHRAFGAQPNIFGQPSGPAWSTPVAIAFLLGCFALSIAAAWALYATVERPAMRRFSRPNNRHPHHNTPQPRTIPADTH